jgi:3-oxoacyl-[acyl-carrier protein] reductase
MSIKGKIILITGGTKGIGYGIAASLMAQNAKVAVTGRSQESVDEASTNLNKLGRGEAIGIVADVRNADSQQSAVNTILKKWGAMDVLIANAGLGHFASIETLTTDQWLETIDTNLTGV